MRRNEAYEVLGLTENASDDDIRKAFRKLAAENHPDKNSGSKESEEKFKEINTAYQILTNKEQAEDERNSYGAYNGQGAHHINLNDIMDFMNQGGGGSPFDAFFGGQRRQTYNVDLSPINLFMKLSFEESVLGCDKKVSYDRKCYCESCDGLGKSKQNLKKCNKCNGSGFFKQKMGNGVFITTQTQACSTCNGAGTMGDPCNDCSGNGYNMESQSLNVKIPPIGGNEMTLSVGGKGNHYKEHGGEVLIHLSPTREGSGKYSNFSLDNRDVRARVCVNLNTLLFGGEIKIPVVGGEDQTITIPKLADLDKEFYLNSFGARKYSNLPLGKQIVTLKINYPSKDKLSDELLEKLNKAYE
jgi:molecular chaperone DnaJ